MNRILPVILLVASTNVAAFDLRSLGDLEVLNDLGQAGRTVGEVARVIDQTIVVTGGGTSSSRTTASQVNRGVGHAKQLGEKVKQGNTSIRDIPYRVQDVQDLWRYVER